MTENLWGHWSQKRRRNSIRRRGLRTCTWQGSKLVTYVSRPEHWSHYVAHSAARHGCGLKDMELWVILPNYAHRLAKSGELLCGEALGILTIDVDQIYLAGPFSFGDDLAEVARQIIGNVAKSKGGQSNG